MEIELKFFATLRETVGERTITREFSDGTTIGTVLDAIVDEYPSLEIFNEDGDVYDHVNILINGENITFSDGLKTPLADGDSVGIFPPVEGG